MPLIKREKKEVLKPFTVRIEVGLLGRLDEYARYLESSRDHVIGEAIRYIIDRDKEFTGDGNLPQNLRQDPPQIPHQNPHQISHQDPHQNPERKAAATK